MRTYRYSYTTKMGVTQWATRTTYNNKRYTPKRKTSPLGDFIIDQTARTFVNFLFK